MVRVWIVYQPHLVADLFERLFQSIDSVTVVPHPFGGLDVIVLPLNDLGQPELDLLPYPVPPAKLIAVSPAADRALIRLPGAAEWAEVRPFAVHELLAEVRAGRQRAAAPELTARTMPVRRARPETGLSSLAAHLVASVRAWLPPRSRRLNRAVSVLTAVLVVSYYLSVGTIAAAEAAVPGEALYGVKRLTENAQLAVAPPAQDVELNAQFAERRLQEIEVLAKRGIMLPTIIEDMAASTEAALNSGLPGPEVSHVLVALAELTRRQQQVLSTIVQDAADPATEAAVARALQVSANGHQQAVAAITNIQAETGVAVAAVTTNQPAVSVTRIPLVEPTVPATSEPASTPVPIAQLESTRVPDPTNPPIWVPSSPTREPSATNSATPRPTQTPEPTATDTLEATAAPTNTLAPASDWCA